VNLTEEKILKGLQSAGIRVYGKTIVSPLSMHDSPNKCQLINFMVERAGYRLIDERGYPRKPEAAPAESTA
jgi:hypothetical protein